MKRTSATKIHGGGPHLDEPRHRAGTHLQAISGTPRNCCTPRGFARSSLLSSMAYRTIREFSRRVDVLASNLDKAFRMAMALKTPLHEECVFTPRHRHLINRSVAGRTTNSPSNVNAVIEVNEVRQIVHTSPFQRAILAKAGAHGLEGRTIRPNLGMAVHAGLGGRNSRKTAFFD